MIGLTTLLYIRANLANMYINLTCNIDFWIYVSWKIHSALITVWEIITSWLATEKRSESLSWNIELDWELILCIVSCKTDNWDSLRACVGVWQLKIVPVFGVDSLRACVGVCIVYEIMSMFDIDSSRSCPCLAVIDYEIVSLFNIDSSRSCPCLPLIMKSLFNWFLIEQREGLSCTWIDTAGFERPLWSRAFTSTLLNH